MNYKPVAWFLLVWLCLLCPDVFGKDNRAFIEKELRHVLQQTYTDNVFRKELIGKLVIGNDYGSVIFTHDDAINVIYLKRVPKQLKIENRKSMLNSLVIMAAVKQQAIEDRNFKALLDQYAYPDILIEYTGNKIVDRVTGSIASGAKTIKYYPYEDFFGAHLQIPKSAIAIYSTEIIGAHDSDAYYKAALIKNYKLQMKNGHYEDAARMIFELKRFHFLSKNSLIDLYECYFRVGETDQGKRVLSMLTRRFQNQITADDCMQIAAIAESAQQMAVAYEWYDQADKLISQPVSVEDILNKF